MTETEGTTRSSLSFIRWQEGGIDSHWNVPHDPTGEWDKAVDQGRSLFAEVAKLAQANEAEALLALRLAANSGDGWKTGGWGIEQGFSAAMAEMAIVGLRATRLGLIER
jgi:hypothetical protein